MADRGWVCVSIDYRVSPRHTWPDHIVDVKRALAWIKENIAEYGGDPDFVAITGGSAGGHLCALAALTPTTRSTSPGFEDADTSVVAAVPIYGRYDWDSTEGAGRWEFVAFCCRSSWSRSAFAEHRQVYLDASPITRVRPDAATVFHPARRRRLAHPVPEAREFVEALRDVSKATVAYAEIPHAQHAFDFFGSPRGPLHRRGGREVPVLGARHPRPRSSYCAIAVLDDRQLLGKPSGAADFDECIDHRVGQLVRVSAWSRRRAPRC